MPIAYILTPQLRMKLKQPLGLLIKGSFAETMNRFNEIAIREKPPQIISVGDTVSRNLVQNNILPHLMIVDNLAMRKGTQSFSAKAEKMMRIKNPQGTITAEAVQTIQEALKDSQRVKIVVDGEEDLLALIVILHSPMNSLVVYGQPYEGIVVVKVTSEKKAEIVNILKDMENVRKAK
ncbi:MAG TPA: DUF359 domain-containing protein [Candidatus Acidoferrum sp.]|nr:DUF359 domain-containing protein [Candidatus Acidoferrum sp.]